MNRRGLVVATAAVAALVGGCSAPTMSGIGGPTAADLGAQTAVYQATGVDETLAADDETAVGVEATGAALDEAASPQATGADVATAQATGVVTEVSEQTCPSLTGEELPPGVFFNKDVLTHAVTEYGANAIYVCRVEVEVADRLAGAPVTLTEDDILGLGQQTCLMLQSGGSIQEVFDSLYFALRAAEGSPFAALEATGNLARFLQRAVAEAPVTLCPTTLDNPPESLRPGEPIIEAPAAPTPDEPADGADQADVPTEPADQTPVD